jgi:CubicO group peptidase (beta-lactamase class C family)
VSELQRLVEEHLAATGEPSCSVAVGVGPNVVDVVAMGTGVGPNTAYRLASVTKPWAAAAVLRLVDRGLLDLDEPIAHRLPAVGPMRHPDGEEPTIRQVLQHRAGFGMHHRFFYDDEPPHAPGPRATAETYARPVLPAGERFCYSNIGYGLVGILLEHVTRRPLAQVIDDEVLRPLGMRDSGFGSVLAADIAPAYGGDDVRYPSYTTDTAASSLGIATARDLARFGIGIVAPDGWLDAGLVDEAWDGLPTFDARGDYGLGWEVRRFGNVRLVSHQGGMPGVGALLAIVPEHRLVVAAIGNRTFARTPRLIVEDTLRSRVPAMASVAALFPEPPQVRPSEAPVDPSLLGRWTGSACVEGGQCELRLDVFDDGRVAVAVGAAPASVATRILSNARLTALAPGLVPSVDAAAAPHTVGLQLWDSVELDGLRGALIALSQPAVEGGAPAGRLRQALSHPASLRRTGST